MDVEIRLYVDSDEEEKFLSMFLQWHWSASMPMNIDILKINGNGISDNEIAKYLDEGEN